MKTINIALFFNNIRGLEVLKFLKHKKNINIKIVFLAKKNLNKDIIKKINYKKNLLKIIQNIDSESIIKYIKKNKIDLNIIAGFPYIFKDKLIDAAKYGTINLHAGSLPKYRGGSPLNWQIINNEKKIGISILKVNKKIDCGEIIDFNNFVLKKSDSIKEVHNKANKIFPKMTYNAIKKICISKIKKFKKQNDKNSKYYNQRTEKDGIINWNKKDNLQIFNLIRAISKPYPSAFTFNHKGKKIKIYSSKIFNRKIKNLKIGQVNKHKKNTYVGCKKGIIQIISSSEKLVDREILH